MSENEQVRRQELIEMIERCELVSVLTQACHAERHAGVNPSSANISLAPEVSPGKDRVDYRFTMKVEFKGEGAVVADVSASAVAHFSISEGSSIRDSVLNAFGSEVAIMAVYPYLRQHIYDLASRIGIPNVNLGLLKRHDGNQVAVSLDLLIGT